MAFIGVVGLGLILCIWLGSGAMAYAVVVGLIVVVIMIMVMIAASGSNIMAKIIGGAIAFGGPGLVIKYVADSAYDPWPSAQFFNAFLGLFEIAACVILGSFIIVFFDDELHR